MTAELRVLGQGQALQGAAHGVRFDPAAPMLFVINSSSGAQDISAKCAVIEAALASHGRQGVLRVCRPADLRQVATEAAAAAVARGSAVVAVGGDGSLNTVAQAAHAAGCAMGAREVVEGALRYHTHSAARSVRGLRHRIEGAVAADGNHGCAIRQGNGCRLLRHTGQIGRAAKQQISAPIGSSYCGFDDFARRVRMAAARCGIDDELQR